MLDMESIKRDLKSEVKPRKVIRYALVPQVRGIANPLKDVFSILVKTIGLLFIQAKLIDADNPNAQGRGVGSIWAMIVDASARLEFTREKIPQLTVFYSVVAMIVFSLFATFTLVSRLFFSQAHAQTINNSIFVDSGYAYNWLNILFPYDAAAGTSTGIAAALGSTLSIYNTGILCVASLFALWSIISMIVDSAHHGKWGGERHSALYAPIRLVFAIGILTPIDNGYNAAQIIAVEIAHMGSGLANSVWSGFVTNLLNIKTQNAFMPGGDLNPFLQKMFMDNVCVDYYNKYASTEGITPQIDWTGIPYTANVSGATATSPNTTLMIGASTTTVTSYKVNFNRNQPDQDGLCGSLIIPAVNQAMGTATPTAWKDTINTYYTNSGMDAVAQQVVSTSNVSTATGTVPTVAIPWATWTSGLQSALDTEAQTLASNYSSNAESASNTILTQAESDGWVSAGALFLRIAKTAQDISEIQSRSVSANLPSPDIMPTLDQIKSGNIQSNCAWYQFWCSQATNDVRGGLVVAYNSLQKGISQAGDQAPDVFGTVSASTDSSSSTMRQLLRETGLSNILGFFNVVGSENGNANSPMTSFGQPLFQAVYFGKLLGLLDSGLFIMAMGSGVSIVGFSAGPGVALVLTFFGSIFFPLTLLFSVYLPLMPTVRFLFGILTWLLSIFEALLGLPVVALWHLRSEGEGLFAHGQQGYLMLLQMMLRPSLMVFGLIGSIMIFDVLFNFISYSVFGTYWNMTNFNLNPLNDLKEILPFFGFLTFYGFMVYSIANLSFNLINAIPDRILAWIGTGLSIGTNQDDVQGASQGAMGGMQKSGQKALSYGAMSMKSYEVAEKDSGGNILKNPDGSVKYSDPQRYTGAEKMALLGGNNISTQFDQRGFRNAPILGSALGTGNQIGGGYAKGGANVENPPDDVPPSGASGPSNPPNTPPGSNPSESSLSNGGQYPGGMNISPDASAAMAGAGIGSGMYSSGPFSFMHNASNGFGQASTNGSAQNSQAEALFGGRPDLGDSTAGDTSPIKSLGMFDNQADDLLHGDSNSNKSAAGTGLGGSGGQGDSEPGVQGGAAYTAGGVQQVATQLQGNLQGEGRGDAANLRSLTAQGESKIDDSTAHAIGQVRTAADASSAAAKQDITQTGSTSELRMQALSSVQNAQKAATSPSPVPESKT